ncbi:MAG TPA: MMPL family transporter, partial [Novosphingobium sp.]|nr:MMPL family transporter [Novosphingobium sp.]
EATRRLIDAQPLLGGLASDPSLHGIAATLATVADGAAKPGAAPADQLATPLARLSSAIDDRLAGRHVFFSWQRLFADGAGPLSPPIRRVLVVHPRLDFSDLEPGSAAVDAINQTAARLQIDAAHGQHVGITGQVPLADEEFGSIRENIGLVGALMVAAMVVCLWLATRSARMVGAIMGTIAVGLVITLALGLLAVHRLNLISVAFIPLFVGLGVDFGIQVSVRFNAERAAGAEPMQALERMAAAIGEPLLMAAGAIFLALAAFLPTAYIGIAELGVIAGLGMIVAFGLNITLLPALLVLLKPAAPAHRVGWAGAAAADRWLHRHRKGILASFAGAVVATIAALPLVAFDFNPLHLRDPRAPAMATLADLMRDADRTPNTISILAPDAGQAGALAARLGRLPEVAHAVSIDSFVPEGQPDKLALIQDASLLLDAAINPFDLPTSADDTATQAKLHEAADRLRALAAARPGALGRSAAALAVSFERLAAASPASRADIAAMLEMPLAITLDKIRASLQAGEVSRASLPADLAADWVAKDGSALVQVTPAGNSLDNRVLTRFTAAVRAQAPHASGLPVATQEAARTVAGAFVQAG